MVTCSTAEALIVRDADGELGAAERSALDAHAAGCARCAARRRAHAAVRAVLAVRADADVPPGFSARLDARLRGEGEEWFSRVDWRRWTEWILPVAAALLLCAAYAGRAAESAAPSRVVLDAGAVDSWALGPDAAAAVGAAATGQDVSSDDLLAAMLGAQAPASPGGVRDGR
jgi:anti-sigma factor RsiW